MLLIYFIIYLIGVIVVSLVLKKYFPEKEKDYTIVCGVVVEETNNNIGIAVLWPLSLIFLILLSPIIISSYIDKK